MVKFLFGLFIVSRIIKIFNLLKGKDMKSIYNSILTTKNGSTIPVFRSGKTAESKYNPQLEAQKIVDGINKNCDFFILIGIRYLLLLKHQLW